MAKDKDNKNDPVDYEWFNPADLVTFGTTGPSAFVFSAAAASRFARGLVVRSKPSGLYRRAAPSGRDEARIIKARIAYQHFGIPGEETAETARLNALFDEAAATAKAQRSTRRGNHL